MAIGIFHDQNLNNLSATHTVYFLEKMEVRNIEIIDLGKLDEKLQTLHLLILPGDNKYSYELRDKLKEKFTPDVMDRIRMWMKKGGKLLITGVFSELFLDSSKGDSFMNLKNPSNESKYAMKYTTFYFRNEAITNKEKPMPFLIDLLLKEKDIVEKESNPSKRNVTATAISLQVSNVTTSQNEKVVSKTEVVFCNFNLGILSPHHRMGNYRDRATLIDHASFSGLFLHVKDMFNALGVTLTLPEEATYKLNSSALLKVPSSTPKETPST